jgi:hypothetical protein
MPAKNKMLSETDPDTVTPAIENHRIAEAQRLCYPTMLLFKV